MASDIPSFISRWRDFGGEERANKDSFFIELCQVLAIAPPQPKTGHPEQDTYVFEADIRVPHEGGAVTTQKADVYKVRKSPIVNSQIGHREHPRGRAIGAKRRGLSKFRCCLWS